MESKGGKKKSSSSKSPLCYEAPLGYSIEDVRPHGGIKKFRSAAYSNVSLGFLCLWIHAFLGFVLYIWSSNFILFSVLCSACESHPE